MEQLKSKIEAVLFVTAKVLQIEDIAEILEEKPENIEEALLELIMDYASRDGALEIDDENGYILQVKEDYKDIVEKLCPVELKAPVLKTLSVIALKEPIRQRRKVKGAVYKHTGDLSFDQVKAIAEKMKTKSLSRDLKAGIKEVLGTCVAVGITVDGKSPKEVTQEVNDGKHHI